MLTLINRFSKYSVVILGFLAITLSHAQDDRAEDISILDIDANGEVDALTDGLLLLRSMFELTDDALVTGVVDSANCKECDAEGIDQYISTLKESRFGKLSSYDDQNISGSSLDGTTLTIGIENGNSESIDLAPLTNCSAKQDGSRVIISCNDGTSGILASAGTVVTYPIGQSSPADIGEFYTGDYVIVDSNEVLLGGAAGLEEPGKRYLLGVSLPDEHFFDEAQITILNNHEESEIELSTWRGNIFYSDENCTGTKFAGGISGIVRHTNNTFWFPINSTSHRVLLKSLYGGGLYEDPVCINSEILGNFYPVVPFYLPDEILNASYPVSVSEVQ